MAGGSFIGEQDFGPYEQQVNPAMAQYFQTMRSLEESRSRLMQVSQGVVGAVPGAMSIAQQGLMQAQMGMGSFGGAASAVHSNLVGGYTQYQGPITGLRTMGPGTLLGGALPPPIGAAPFMAGRYAYEGQAVTTDALFQNLHIGMQSAARRGLTEVAPQLAMMGGLLYGGPGGMALAGAGAFASVTAPLALRASGIDASLSSEAARRTIQQTLGERLGDMGGANRFRVGRGRLDATTDAYVDYVSATQKQYGMFAPSEEEFRPLLAAAIQTTKDEDLPRLIEKGAGGLKKKLTGLRDAAAELNMQFDEIAQLAVQFGEDGGVGGTFKQFVGDISAAATRGRGLNRRQLASVAIQQRGSALQMGFQGEAAQRGIVALAADIQQQANLGLINRDQLFAFGGNTQAEAAMNTAVARQNMQFQMASGPFGMMSMARQISGAAPGGTLMQGLGNLGGTFAGNPFGFMRQQLDPSARSTAAREAPFQMFRQFQQMFGSGDMGRVLFAQSLAQQTGMSPVQANTMFDRFSTDQRMANQFGKSVGLSGDLVMQAAINAQSVDSAMTLQRFTQMNLSKDEVEQFAGGRSSGLLFQGVTESGFGFKPLSDDEIMDRARLQYEADDPLGISHEAVRKRQSSRMRSASGFGGTLGAQIANLADVVSSGLGPLVDGDTRAQVKREIDKRAAAIRSEQAARAAKGTTTAALNRLYNKNQSRLRTFGLLGREDVGGDAIGTAVLSRVVAGKMDMERLRTAGLSEEGAAALQAISSTFSMEGGRATVTGDVKNFAEKMMAVDHGEFARTALNRLIKEGETDKIFTDADKFARDGISKDEMRDGQKRDAIRRAIERSVSANVVGKDTATTLINSFAGGIFQPIAENRGAAQEIAFQQLSQLDFKNGRLKVTSE